MSRSTGNHRFSAPLARRERCYRVFNDSSLGSRGDPPAGFCYQDDCGSTSAVYGMTSTESSVQVMTTRALTTTTSSGQMSASYSATSTSNEGTSSIGSAVSATKTQAKNSSGSGLRISRKIVLLGIVFLGSHIR